MNTATAAYQRVAYQPRLFVERPTELTLIEQNIQRAREGKPLTQPIINFWGVNGIGKTWLLSHLVRDYQIPNQKGTFAFYYDFSRPFSWSALLRSLISATRAQFSEAQFPKGATKVEKGGEAGAVAEFVKGILALSNHKQLIPLFLFDSTEHLSETAWQSLEAMLIEPLAMSDRAIFVLAGRRPVPKWYRFEARRRVMETEKTQVSAFTEGQIRSQIKQGGYTLPADLLIDNAAGNPWLVYRLAHEIAPNGKPDEKIADILATYEQQLLEGIADDLRELLYLAAPLRFYRVEALRFLAQQQPEQRAAVDGNYLALLRRLESETIVVLWNGQRRAWMTDEMVRRLINRRQFLSSQPIFIEQHERAQALYWHWAREYPTTSEDFILEIWFHLANIYQADGDGERLRAHVYEALDFVRQEKARFEDRLIGLQRQFQHDQELQELLPEELRNSLAHDLEVGPL